MCAGLSVSASACSEASSSRSLASSFRRLSVVTRQPPGGSSLPSCVGPPLAGLRSDDVQLCRLAACAAICNESRLDISPTPPGTPPPTTCRWGRQGEPTEAALKVLVEKLGCPHEELNHLYFQKDFRTPDNPTPFCEFWRSAFTPVALLEFTRDRKSMGCLARAADDLDSDSPNILFVKGAPESILDRCVSMMLPDGSTVPLTAESRAAISEQMASMSCEALRTLAFAMRIPAEATAAASPDSRTGASETSEKELRKIWEGRAQVPADSQATGDTPANRLTPEMDKELAVYDGHLPKSIKHLLEEPENFAKVESQLTFIGLVGLLDPPRAEVTAAIADCRSAGIRVFMITGDNKLTAEAIARKINIIPPAELEADSRTSKTPKGRHRAMDNISITGREFERLPDEEKQALLKQDAVIFSRTEPKHKQMIIRILKELGEVVAMTGDGVNDAPALKQADIGISMGITGTEVAKEASDMVLADDNFSTIVSAVEEGRSIYNNMKAFIRYLISSNIGEVASIFFTAALGVPEGLAPVQLLWVNLVTDGPPATALSFNPPDTDVMRQPPRSRSESLISGWVCVRYLLIGIYVGMATVGVFIWWYVYGVDGNDGHTLISLWQLRHWGQCGSWDGFAVRPVYGMTEDDPCSYFTAGKIKASTLSLTVLVVIEMLNALNALSQNSSLLQMPPWKNPYLLLAIAASIAVHATILYVPILNKIFNVVPLSMHDWLVVLAWASPVIIIDETLKFMARIHQGRQARLRPLAGKAAGVGGALEMQILSARKTD
eukprot:GHVT01017273.1.p1 GENE.GHVT01017273.1~~GHVT01017273.1.p1  ORF type:complete len:780 (+),score=160.49 GHVT01017273.1:126-2465(+)